MSEMRKPDRGTYMGLKALTPSEWESAYRFALEEDDRYRNNWLEIDDEISKCLKKKNKSEAAWWSGYAMGWLARDAGEGT